ncbi:MAG: LPS export ABC transporter periplasmic protein LptC [Candidatus Abyssobacteria bacterium SURF_17]|uniref:LPS export ABC transporter periplasmic protein LptC n=1 Tax=Candidatus Abyssobacteria bacterium SURF_17 TaxID=2093361 RepID=A0A419F6N1_9BACT|nr:MAG: LPS export ABC transporter periplasmic protein LptC [Candidatus Abyssubacteria bacterium SURF_17]
MTFMIMKLLPRVLFVLCSGLLLSSLSCSNKPEKLVIEENSAETEIEQSAQPDKLAQKLQDVRYSQSKGGKLQWEMAAESVEQEGDGPTRLSKVKITYYAENGRVTEATADSAMYNAATGNAKLRGNVVVTTSDGNRMTTDALAWNQAEEILRGEGVVTMSRGDSIIKGKGFELSPEAETFKIFKVEGTIHQGDMDL